MIDPIAFSSMRRTLIKEAFLGGVARGAISAAGQYLSRSAGNIGAGMGVGAAGGGVIGAAQGGMRGYKEEREQGGSGTIGALTGALGGGARGAAVGTAVGGLAGLASGGRGSELVGKAMQGRWNPIGAAGRAGQRQLHSVTGLVPGGAKRGTEEYVKALTDINVGGLGSHARDIAKAEAQVLQAQAARAESKAAFERAARAAQSGQTSVAGLAQNIGEKGVLRGGKELVQHGVAGQWRNSGLLGKATMVGMPLGGAALAALQPDDPDNPDAPKKGERIGESVGSGLAGALTPMIGSTGGSVVSRTGSAVGGTIGKGIDKLVGAVRRPSPNALGGGAATPGASPGLDSPPVERVYSNAALGKPPEGLQV